MVDIGVVPFRGRDFVEAEITPARIKIFSGIVAAHDEIFSDPRYDGFQVQPNTRFSHTIVRGRVLLPFELEDVLKGQVESVRRKFALFEGPDCYWIRSPQGHIYGIVNGKVLNPGNGMADLAIRKGKLVASRKGVIPRPRSIE